MIKGTSKHRQHALLRCLIMGATGSLLIGAGPAPVLVATAVASPQPPFIQSKLPEIDAYFRQQAEADQFSGAVLIAKNGKTVFERGYGLADRDRREPVSTNTKFNLGSINKFITKIAAYQLIGKGKLRPNDTVGKIIPDFPNAAIRDKVTVQQLIDMKGGVDDFMTRSFFQRHKALRTLDDYLALFAHRPLEFEPGTRTAYSNGGYVILGKLIEQVSGMSYDDYVRKHITGPARMISTSLDPLRPGAGYAIGYTRGPPTEDGVRTAALGPNTDKLPGRGSSAAAGYSTVRDFARLDAALRRGKLLPPNLRNLFFDERYRAGTHFTGWNGGYMGVSTTFAMWQDGTTVVIFTNRDPPLNKIARDKVFSILGKPLSRRD